MGTPLEHSHLGPSSWPRWIRCPGSVLAQEGIPDQVRIEAAEGTVFHELAADCLEFGLEPWSFLKEGAGLMVDGFFVEYDEDMCRYMDDGLEYVRAMENTPGWEVYVEVRMDISPWTLPGQFGTGDVIMINVKERKIIVFDWKYGKEPVYPVENYQLSGYALGAWQTICGAKFDWNPADIEVTLIIEQPRVSGAGGAWKTTMTRLLEFGQHARRQAVLSQSEDAPRVPGKAQCRWCRARDSCGAHAAWELEMIGLEFDDLDGGEPPPLPAPEDLTLERQAMLLMMKSMISNWLDAIHKRLYHQAMQEGDIPLMKLVDGKAPARKWDSTQQHKAEMVLKAELGEDGIYGERKMISPAQAEKELGKARYAETIDRFVDQGKKHPILVPREDKRPEIQSAVDMFDDLDDADENVL